MTRKYFNRKLSRRDFLKLAGDTLTAAAGASYLPMLGENFLSPIDIALVAPGDPDLYLAGTDAWISIPGNIPIYHPDSLAEPPFTTL